MKVITFALLLLASRIWTRDPCHDPEIEAIDERPLFIYRESDIRTVTIYNCRYVHENQIRKCDEDNTYFFAQNHTDADFTNNCILAFKNGTFIDKYGSTRTVNLCQPTNVYLYPIYDAKCFVKDIRITFTQFQVQANLTQNEITLPSGTTCRYDYGFCYDEKIDTEFVWEVVEKTEKRRNPDCDKLQRVRVNGKSFFLTLNKHFYLISKVENEFVALHLDKENRTLCNVSAFRTIENTAFVSKENIPGVITLDTFKKRHYTVHFKKKQQLYDFLIRKCQHSFSTTTSDDLISDIFKVAIQVEEVVLHTEQQLIRQEEDEMSLVALKRKMKILKKTILRVVVVLSICAIIFVGISVVLLFKFVAKHYSAITKACFGFLRPDRVSANVANTINEMEPNYNATYETITDEYDINSVYGKQVSNNVKQS